MSFNPGINIKTEVFAQRIENKAGFQKPRFHYYYFCFCVSFKNDICAS